VHQALSTVLVHTIVDALKSLGCKVCLVVCLSVFLAIHCLGCLSKQHMLAYKLSCFTQPALATQVTSTGLSKHILHPCLYAMYADALSLMRIAFFNVQASMLHATEVTAGSPFVLKVTLQSHSPLLQTLEVVLKDSTGFVTSGQCSSCFGMLTSNMILLGWAGTCWARLC